jgi:hypothetical protein
MSFKYVTLNNEKSIDLNGLLEKIRVEFKDPRIIKDDVVTSGSEFIQDDTQQLRGKTKKESKYKVHQVRVENYQ